MYAVVRTGGKQYLVREGEELLVEKLTVDKESTVSLDEVLFVGEPNGKHVLGKPLINGAKVVCRVVDQELGPKLINFKMRRRKKSKRWKGHRQELTRLLIQKIEAGL